MASIASSSFSFSTSFVFSAISSSAFALCFATSFSDSALIRSASASAAKVRRLSSSGVFLACRSSSCCSSLTFSSATRRADTARFSERWARWLCSRASFSCTLMSASFSSRAVRAARSRSNSLRTCPRRSCNSSCSPSRLINCWRMESPSSSSSIFRRITAWSAADRHSSSSFVATQRQQQLVDLQGLSRVPGARRWMAASGQRSSGGNPRPAVSRRVETRTLAMPSIGRGGASSTCLFSSLADRGRRGKGTGLFDRVSAAELGRTACMSTAG
mmetsp:Transcript_3007/g.6275  ORF Transcript_3007/g.6275 Transcript_3007/m.6275 type:complete len:273 (-) Transcript_3007:70-888(-)